MADSLGIALIGLGKHAARTVIPAITRTASVHLARIVVRNRASAIDQHPQLAGLITDDIDAALADPEVSIVYVATPLSTHAGLARMALASGKHVICEKPVGMSLAEATGLCAQAADAGLGLFEVDYFQHHAQFNAIRDQIETRLQDGEALVSAELVFTIPQLPDDDIRYRADLGGGALSDVGYYPLTAALALFGMPDRADASLRLDPVRQIDLSGAALLHCGEVPVWAHWAIGASYRSEIAVSLTRSRLVAQRAFAKPADLVTRLTVASATGGSGQDLEFPPDDAFATMLETIAGGLSTGNQSQFSDERSRILQRARLLDLARTNGRMREGQ